ATGAYYALAHWNAYLANRNAAHKEAFMLQARWLLAREVAICAGAGGWPVSEKAGARPWLSASVQGSAISVLVRAYQLTREEAFLQAARRAVYTFELDILDGGISVPVGESGVFFEEVARYPAAHALKGYFLALFGLYDYVALTQDRAIEALIQRSVTALHLLLDAFDTGYWTRRDLLDRRLASRSCHALHVTLLATFARLSRCEHCAALADRWAHYQPRGLRYLVANRMRAWWNDTARLRAQAFRAGAARSSTSRDRICVPITAFPFQGGMRAVLYSVAQAMHDRWQMTYLTHHKGRDAQGLAIEVFGRRLASPWHFPGIWLYCLSGGSKLFKLLRRDPDYCLILPQDGVFTAAFAALVGKMAGIRVVCMDHGNITLVHSPAFRRERLASFQAYPWYLRIFLRLEFRFYMLSQRFLARVATHCSDQFLVAGDEVEDVYRTRFGVHPGRIMRYMYVIDTARFAPPGRERRTRMRAELGIAEEAIVITLINRLSAEKGLRFALEGIARALAALPADTRARVKVLIAGEGPLRAQVETDILLHDLESVCVLWGEAQPADVLLLLGIADIFLYSGTRGTNYSVAVLEAMAAGCAVIGSLVPQSNAKLLAGERGIAVKAADAAEIGAALVRLCGDPALCRHMGQRAREYITTHHNPLMLKRSLLRASFFVLPIAPI
ncbi:MAG: glycosyltransferase, partial [Chloroflexota bacterium]|nr:glycosyltransferase [Chloroflexota bacterium]